MVETIIGQILGIFATILTFLSYQSNSKQKLLIIQTSATMSTCISYFFLNAMSGFWLNIVCLCRNILYYFEKQNSKFNLVSGIIFAIIMAILGALSWQGYISILIIIALMLNTIILSLGKPQLLRQSILLTSSLVIIYNVYVFSIGGILNESLAIISSIIGIIRFNKNI